ncbi:MAG: DUF1501 domain-containing protein, partial [Planctomycetales bacterium]
MLSILDQPPRLGDGVSRREWLRLGGLGAFGLSLPELLRGRSDAALEEAPRLSGGKAKSCIVLFLLGGPPQHETWDPKPGAPVEIRGDHKPIATAVPGFQVGETMPLTAKLTDKIHVLRAVSTKDNAHSTSGYAMSTGVSHLPLGVEGAKPGSPNNWPCMAAVIKRLRASRGGLPSSIVIPEILANDGNKTWPGQDAGWMGRAADPWLLDCDPSAENFQVPGLALPAEISRSRFNDRKSLLRQVDRRLNRARDDGLVARETWKAQAFDLLGSSKAREAFDLSQEPDAVRDRYGRHKFGQGLLLARRLVEAGVSLTQVNWSRLPNALNNGHWDTHRQNSAALRKHLMPVMDQAYSALLEDLSDRGMLGETLVVSLGEFGRSPKINAAGGRDHWGSVFSIALAGGGIQGGGIHGSSDRLGGQPKSGLVTPGDFTATVYHALGYRPHVAVTDPTG